MHERTYGYWPTTCTYHPTWSGRLSSLPSARSLKLVPQIARRCMRMPPPTELRPRNKHAFLKIDFALLSDKILLYGKTFNFVPHGCRLVSQKWVEKCNFCMIISILRRNLSLSEKRSLVKQSCFRLDYFFIFWTTAQQQHQNTNKSISPPF